MTERLQPILSLLDEGLALYRRHFVRFVLIAACWFVPVAVITGLIVAGAAWLTEFQVTLLTLAAILVSMPLVVYLVGGLSRAAMAAADGRAVHIREALSIAPARAVSMGCFTIIYSVVMQVISSALTLVCICPLWIFGFGLIGVMESALGDSALGAAALALVGLLVGGIYLFALLVGGASYSSMIYALQPWVQEQLPFGKAMERSFQLIGYRFWHNMAAWGIAATLLAAAGLTVTVAVGVLAPLPLLFVLGSDSPIAQAVAVSAWLVGLMLVIPPLPIWMALLYRRNTTRRAGADLAERVQVWALENAESTQ